MPDHADYKDRWQRNRRQDTRLIFYALRSLLTTAALVAIAFAFDVPAKLRAKFWGIPAASQVVVVDPAASNPPRPQPAPPAKEPAADPFPDPPRRKLVTPPESPSTFAAPAGDTIVVHDRSAAKKRPQLDKPPRPEPVVEPPPEHWVTLDLAKRVAKVPLDESVGGSRMRIVGLRDTDAQTELKPPDGLLVDQVEIIFPEVPRARILVRTDKIGARLALEIEPQMALWAEDPMPMVLKKVQSEAHRSRVSAAEFNRQLVLDKQRHKELELWLNNARGVPLDDYKRGKYEHQWLTTSIKERDAQVDAMAQAVAEMEALETLVLSLHGKAKLCFELVDSD